MHRFNILFCRNGKLFFQAVDMIFRQTQVYNKLKKRKNECYGVIRVDNTYYYNNKSLKELLEAHQLKVSKCLQ